MDHTKLIEGLNKKYEEAITKEAPLSDYGIFRGIQGGDNNDGTTIYMEVDGKRHALPRQAVNDVLGNNLGKEIWDYIKNPSKLNKGIFKKE